MNELSKMFPSLTTFSDIDWDAVTQEYQTNYIDISFPEYLQQKALDGDCPPYLFELAYYELASYDALVSQEPFPFTQGVYLNPTALFLSLEFDVRKMLAEARHGKVEVHERPHVLCLFKDQKDRVHSLELDTDSLMILQQLENGPLQDPTPLQKINEEALTKLIDCGLVLISL